MDEMKEAQLRRMLKSQGASHSEINEIIAKFEKSEQEELTQAQDEEPIQETEQELSEEEKNEFKRNLMRNPKALAEYNRKKIAEKMQEPVNKGDLRKIQESLTKTSDSTNTVNSKKLSLLKQIEQQITEREKTLDALILENQNLRNELLKQNAEFAKQLGKDRIDAREAYARGLESFFGKVFNTITNFSDSQTEKSLILLFCREGSSVGLKSVLSSKKVLSVDDLKIEG